eukprot:6455097-Amphidinium_carterae.3
MDYYSVMFACYCVELHNCVHDAYPYKDKDGIDYDDAATMVTACRSSTLMTTTRLIAHQSSTAIKPTTVAPNKICTTEQIQQEKRRMRRAYERGTEVSLRYDTQHQYTHHVDKLPRYLTRRVRLQDSARAEISNTAFTK